MAVQTQALQLALNLSDIVTEGKGSMHHSRPIEHGGRVPGNSYLNCLGLLTAWKAKASADGKQAFIEGGR